MTIEHPRTSVVTPWKSSNESVGSLSKVRKQFKKVKNITGYAAELASDYYGFGSRYETRVLTDEEDITEARIFATQTFADLGKISRSKIDIETGLLKNDTLLDNSVFLGVYEKGEMLGTVRMVTGPEMTVEDTRMPMEQLPQESRDLLRSLEPGTYAEVGAAAKKRGVGPAAMLRLNRELFRTAHKMGIKNLGFGLEPQVQSLYKDYSGGLMRHLNNGENVYFPGINGPQAPYLMQIGENIDDSIEGQRSDKGQSTVKRLVRRAVAQYFKDASC